MAGYCKLQVQKETGRAGGKSHNNPLHTAGPNSGESRAGSKDCSRQ